MYVKNQRDLKKKKERETGGSEESGYSLFFSKSSLHVFLSLKA
jgi:hypothetical protein